MIETVMARTTAHHTKEDEMIAIKEVYTAEELVGLTGFKRPVIDKWFTETGRWHDNGPVVKSTLTQGEVTTMLARGNSNRRNSKARAFLAELRGESASGIDTAEMNKAIALLNSENEDDDFDVEDDEIEADEEGDDEAPKKRTKKNFSTAAVTKRLTICKKCRRPNSNGYQYCSACHKAYRPGNRTARAKMTA